MGSIDIELVQLIGVIYDAVVDPGKWHEALDRVRLHFQLHNVMMALHDLRSRPTSLSVLINISDEWAAAMAQPEYNSELMRLLGGQKRIEGWPLEEPVNALGVVDQKTMDANKYYTDLALPTGSSTALPSC